MKKFFIILAATAINFSSIIAQQIEYTNFNTGNWNGWITVNGSFTNEWVVGNATGYNNTGSAYISNDGGTTNSYTTNEESVVHFYKDINFSFATDITMLTFRWKSKGETSKDFMSVHVVPTTFQPVAGEVINEGQLSGTEFEGFDFYRGYRFKLGTDLLTQQTMRVVFSWRNDNSGGEQTPAAVDNIEITNQDYNYGTWSSRLNLPSARYYAASMRNGFGMISLGGLGVNNVPKNEVLEYDLVADRYENLPNLTNTITHNIGVKFDGALLSIGGYKDGASLPTDEVYRMDLKTFTWSDYGNYSKKIFYGRAAVIDHEQLYVLGGSDENNNLLNDVNYLSKGSNIWNSATPMPGDGRGDGAVTSLDKGRILYVGGYTNNFERLQVDSVLIGAVNPSNPADITWTRGTNFPGGPKARFQAYSWGNGKAIIVGGSSSDDFSSTSEVWVYDADGDSWTAWTQLPNKTTPITAYQGTSFRLADNIWQLNIAGGITSGPIWTASHEMYIDTLETIVSVQEITEEIPSEYRLQQNFPNPFNPVTRLQFSIPNSSFVKIEVFNTLGEIVEILVSENLAAGIYNYSWNASGFSSGIYFYKLQAGNFIETKKMILMK